MKPSLSMQEDGCERNEMRLEQLFSGPCLCPQVFVKGLDYIGQEVSVLFRSKTKNSWFFLALGE